MHYLWFAAPLKSIKQLKIFCFESRDLVHLAAPHPVRGKQTMALNNKQGRDCFPFWILARAVCVCALHSVMRIAKKGNLECNVSPRMIWVIRAGNDFLFQSCKRKSFSCLGKFWDAPGIERLWNAWPLKKVSALNKLKEQTSLGSNFAWLEILKWLKTE